MSESKKTGLELLREPFKEHQISKLPKPYTKDSPKGKCSECGGYHGLPAVHLDYVGHAALTDRLLDADPNWNWEPVSVNEDGSPKFDKDNGLWIKLTVCGVTRLGYGFPDGKTGGNALKETIGDALRNAAMRFGAALDLWHKGDLHLEEKEETPEKTFVERTTKKPEIDFKTLVITAGKDAGKKYTDFSKEYHKKKISDLEQWLADGKPLKKETREHLELLKMYVEIAPDDPPKTSGNELFPD